MRHARGMGLTSQYRNDELSRYVIRSFIALPLLPATPILRQIIKELLIKYQIIIIY